MMKTVLACAGLLAVAGFVPLSAVRAPRRAARTATAAASDDRSALAAKWIANEGFYTPADTSMMADDFVFMGPVVGPLNTADYLGTLGVFRVYDAFPDLRLDIATPTQDPADPDRYWSVIRVQGGRHSGTLNLGGGVTVAATGNDMTVGPQAVSVTFDADNKVSRWTGGYVENDELRCCCCYYCARVLLLRRLLLLTGRRPRYIADVRDGETGAAGAMFAVMTACGVPTPAPGGRVVKVLNWVGAKRKDYPKGRSHADDLPPKWKPFGREHGLRTSESWSRGVK